MKYIIPSLLAALAPLLSQPASAQTPARSQIQPISSPPTNLYGAPLLNKNGRQINYNQGEMDSQKAQWLAKGGSIETPPPGGCEATGALAKWKWFNIGDGIGSAGFAVSDSTHGREMIVTGGGLYFGGPRYWQTYQQNTGTGEYTQKFTSPVYGPGPSGGSDLRQLLTGNFDHDPFHEIVVVLDGSVEVWDQNTRQLERTFPVLNAARCARLVDMNQDGTLDLVLANPSTTQVYDGQGQNIWSYAEGSLDVAIGQMDSDASLEIALNTGSVIDYDTASVQWHWLDGFTGHLESGDIDGDGLDELIVAHYWGEVRAFDVDTFTFKWTMSVFSPGATDLVDIDQDGELELVIGEAQWGDILIYDANTHVLEGSIDNPGHGVTEVIVADADNDGMLEVIWGTGHSTTARDIMYVADWSTESIEWASFDLDGPFRTPVMGDVTGDGVDEIVTVCNRTNSDYGAARILVFDSQSLELLAMSQEVNDGVGWSDTHEIELAQLDSDSALEMVIASSRTNSSSVEVYDFDGISTFTRIWASPNSGTPYDRAVVDVSIADLEGDGSLEIIGILKSGLVYVYSAESEVLEWVAPFQITGGARELEVGNTDTDPALELLVLGNNETIYIFDGITQAVQETVTGFDATTISLIDPGLGSELLMIGTQNGDLVTVEHDGRASIETARVNLANAPLEQLVIRNGQVAFAGVDGALRMYSTNTGAEIWGSCRDYGNNFGQGIGFGPNYIVTSGMYGLVLFGRHQ